MPLPNVDEHVEEEFDEELLDGEGDLTVEQRARMRGWKPLEEYHGTPSRWRSAEEFMRLADSEMPVLRRNNQYLEKKVSRLGGQLDSATKTIQEMAESIKRLEGIAARNDKAGYDRAMRELKAERAAAVQAGDTTAFDQIEQQIEALGDRPSDPPPAPPPAEAPKVPQEVQDFIEENPWYASDKGLNRAMIANFDVIEQRWPAWSLTKKLAEAKRRTMADFPDRFEGAEEEEAEPVPLPPRRPAAPVSRPRAGAERPQRNTSGWEQITDAQERREAQAEFKRQQIADPGLTEGEYLEIYLNPRADILALRKARKA